ncbi:MAG: twin transmembrane helix small protein [Thiobacillus sp.]|jgi:flagellar biosynthesis protein FlhB
MLTKIIILTLIAFILISLFSALTFIYRDKDKGDSTRAVRALTVRISLSIALFLMLLAGFYFGIIPQRGL